MGLTSFRDALSDGLAFRRRFPGGLHLGVLVGRRVEFARAFLRPVRLLHRGQHLFAVALEILSDWTHCVAPISSVTETPVLGIIWSALSSRIAVKRLLFSWVIGRISPRFSLHHAAMLR